MVRERLSENFSWDEVTITSQRDVDNDLPIELVGNAKFTATRMETVRLLLNSPIIVSSWYRSLQLNTLIGGSKNSDHMLACAVDFISPRYGMPARVAKKLARYADVLNFKQLIYEHNWIHISWDPTPGAKARKQVLTLLTSKNYVQGITDKLGNVIV
jgi:zinc D-Ala-D-Ala carboxypeptidase